MGNKEMNRREFLYKAYQLGGLAALYSMGVSYSEAMMLIHGKPSSAAAPCTTSQQAESAAQNAYVHVGYTGQNWYATQFVYSGTSGKAICQIDIPLCAVGSPTADYYIDIYSDDGGSPPHPNVSLGTSDAYDSSTIPSCGSENTTSLTFSSPTSAITNGITYWVVFHTATGDGSNYLRWFQTDGTTERFDKSSDGSTWTNQATNKTMKYELFSQ